MTKTSWKVTIRTGQSTWTTVTLDAATHADAIESALSMFPGTFVEIV